MLRRTSACDQSFAEQCTAGPSLVVGQAVRCRPEGFGAPISGPVDLSPLILEYHTCFSNVVDKVFGMRSFFP